MQKKKEKLPFAVRKIWEAAGGGKMLLGVSGGADSTALLLAFNKANIPFEIAHCNFNLRSAESLRDREFVKVLGRNFGVPVHSVDFDTHKEAVSGESIEMTCRRLRYDYFHKLKEEGDFNRIVIAHNADDNIETFFLNLLRGSGAKGLSAMEVDNGEILRPLLPYRRREILEFLKTNNQNFVTDSSNLKSEDYRRNFLRNEVFPLLESKWEGFARTITSTIDLHRRENNIVAHFTAKALEDVQDFLPWHVIYNFPDTETIIFSFIRRFGGSPTIAREMAASAEKLLPGKKWTLDNNVNAIFTRKGIIIERPIDQDIRKAPPYKWEKLEGDGINFVKIMTSPLSELYLTAGEENFEWQPANIKMKIKSLGLEGSQPVWKVLKDAGLTPQQRKEFMILVDKKTSEPIWLPGIKRSRLYLVTQESKEVYHLSK